MRSLALTLGLAALIAVPAAAQQKTWTVNADFDSGTFENTRDTPTPNIVILGRTPVSQTRVVWVDNTDPNNRGGPAPQLLSPGWVLRMDSTIGSTLGRQIGRYDAALLSINGVPTGAPATGNNPGRVAVDTNGDVWIVNRAYYEGAYQGSLTKIAGNIAHCIDRNNNGVIDTSHDANGDGIIDPYKTPGLGTPAAQVEYYAQNDECILATIPIGVPGDIPRSVAVDRNGKIWVGSWNGHTVYRFNPNEPVALEASRVFTTSGFPITGWFYSAATADDYVYFTSNSAWSGSSGTGHVIRININNLSQADYVTCGGGAGTCGSTYGIVAIPGTHKAWAGAYSGTGVYKVDFDASPPTCTCVTMPAQITAVTYDLNGKIWVSGYNTGSVYRVNPNNNAIEATCPTGGSNPHGLSVDFDGYIWSVQDGGPNMLVRFDPVATSNNCGRTAYPIDRGSIAVPTGQNVYTYGPYLYSDFTGTQIDRQAPYAYVGTWDAVYDGQAAGIAWSKVSWNSEAQGAVPMGTFLTMSARAADTTAALATSGYSAVTNGGALTGLVGRYVQVRATLSGPGWMTPQLADVTVAGPCATIGDGCCIRDLDCNDSNACTTDTCPAPGGACQHTPIAGCCLTSADCNDSNPCTSDTCPTPGGQCVITPIVGCCLANGDCDDGNACSVDVCTGVGGSCMHPLITGCCNSNAECPASTVCTTVACTGVGGSCQSTPVPNCCTSDGACDDDDPCTVDSCNVGNGECSHAAISGCCNVNADCATGVLCMLDECTGPGGVCTSNPITGCCTVNADCATGNPCRVGTCDTPGGTCAVETVAGCCAVDADCDDGNPCTVDTCPEAGGACANVATDGCCLVDGDCDDGDSCTRDACSYPGGTCGHAAIPSCCHTQDDCPAGTACSNGLCVTGASSDAAVPNAAGADAGTPGGSPSGCDCHAASAPATGPAALLTLLLVGVVSRRPRRRR